MTERVKFINGDYYDVEVHFSTIHNYDHILEFKVYPVSQWTGMNNESGWSYYNKTDSDHHDVFSEEHSKMIFYGSYRWRGVWESRIYFPDGEEYWGSELMEMARIFKEWVAPWCKEWLQKQQPEFKMEDESI